MRNEEKELTPFEKFENLARPLFNVGKHELDEEIAKEKAESKAESKAERPTRKTGQHERKEAA